MNSLVLNFLVCLLFLNLHFGIMAGIIVYVNKRFGLPKELYRKLLHMVAVFSIMPIVVPSRHWLVSVLVCAAFQLEAFLAGKFSSMLKTVDLKERKSGEQQNSMFLLYATYMFVILNCWGAMGHKWMAVLSIVAWGVGDAAAALVGKQFGKHKLQGKMIEGTKSIEGSIAMFIMSFLSVFMLYHRHTDITSVAVVILVCLGIAFLSTFAELFSKKGLDTVICPSVAMISFMMLKLFANVI